MYRSSHEKVTDKVFDILETLDTHSSIVNDRDEIVHEAGETDSYEDLEFVLVLGGIGSGGRDDPHRHDLIAINDMPLKKIGDKNITSFNHYIDIRKDGEGHFDDYDGYSYKKGSASKGEHQNVSDLIPNYWIKAFVKDFDLKVDKGFSIALSRMYVHAPGRKWYKNECSPAIERYSFFEDKGIYPNAKAEAKKRFPLAGRLTSPKIGVPNSVFMPVDNLARYWYMRYKADPVPKYLGPVMHAIQDASIPHHAAGCSGNWHDKYEDDLNSFVGSWLNDTAFEQEVKDLITLWNVDDSSPPAALNRDEWNRSVARNWRIDMLVTWMALNSYRAYDQDFLGFRNEYTFREDVMKDLTRWAMVICAIVLNNV